LFLFVVLMFFCYREPLDSSPSSRDATAALAAALFSRVDNLLLLLCVRAFALSRFVKEKRERPKFGEKTTFWITTNFILHSSGRIQTERALDGSASRNQ